MITRVRITSEQSELFQFCWDLYLDSFPKLERRSKEYHLETLKREEFHFDVVIDAGKPIGFVAWWDFEEWRFIEHFATLSTLRGQGYGAKILLLFSEESPKPIILEVEHPTDDISRRRIEFYKRLGLILNEHQYQHPSYHQIKDEVVRLMIMSYPKPIEADELQKFVTEYIPIIHFRNFNKPQEWNI